MPKTAAQSRDWRERQRVASARPYDDEEETAANNRVTSPLEQQIRRLQDAEVAYVTAQAYRGKVLARHGDYIIRDPQNSSAEIGRVVKRGNKWAAEGGFHSGNYRDGFRSIRAATEQIIRWHLGR